MLSPEAEGPDDPRFLDLFRRGEPIRRVRTVCLTSDRRRLGLVLNAFPSRDTSGAITGITRIICQDAAEQQNAATAQRCLAAIVDAAESVENPAGLVMRPGQIAGLANHAVLIGRHGREHPIADSAAPIRDASGAMLGVVLVFRDVTGQRRAEDAIAEQREWAASLHRGRIVPEEAWIAE